MAAVLVAGSLVVRLMVRGRYYPGWDIVLATQGTFVASTKSVREALALPFDPGAWGFQSVPTHSVLCALLPGYLGRLWPWEYWAHLVTFLIVVATLSLIAIAMQLPARRWWIILLAWGASPALLSFAVAGFPYATAYLPHALALLAVLHPRVRRSWFLGPLLCVAALATAWQVYDPGKTFFVVFLAGALLLRDVPVPARLLWLATAALQLDLVITHPSGPAVRFMSADVLGLWRVIDAARYVATEAFVTRSLDLPFLIAAAFVALSTIARDRLFLASQLAAQLGLVVLLTSAGPGDLRPRRYILVGYSALVVVAAAFRAESRSRADLAVASLLAIGMAAQVVDLVAFVHGPRPIVDYPLPYTYSQVDYMVAKPPIDWAARMSDDVLAGDTVLVVYGRFAYDENASNPTRVLERVYLRVGHERFVRSVFVFSSQPCEMDCLPIRPLTEVDASLDGVVGGLSGRPTRVHLYYSQDLHRTYEHTFVTEAAIVFGAIRRRFALRDQTVLGPTLLHFLLVPRAADAGAGIAITNTTGAIERGASGSGELVSLEWSGPPFEHYWVVDEPRPPRSPYVDPRPWGPEPLRVRLRGMLRVERAGRYEVLLGADESTELRVDGELLSSKSGGQFRVTLAPLSLTAGSHTIEAAASDADGVAHMLVDVYREGE